MGSPNGGIVGVVNPTSFGKCTQTIATSGSTTLTTQPGTRLVAYAVVAGGGSGGNSKCNTTTTAGGGGAGGLRTCSSFAVSGAAPYPIVVGGGGAAKSTGPANGNSGSPSIFSTTTR